MQMPARTMVWMLWRRHRWGFLAIGGWLLAVLALRLVVPPGQVFVIDALSILPAGMLFPYLMVVFAYGSYEADLIAPESCFPARMFTLPVRTASLVTWPMLLGTATVAILWLILAGFVWHSDDSEVPLWWPASACAAALAWVQALIWTPFGWPVVRILLVVVVAVVLVVLPQLALAAGVPEAILALGIAALVPAAGAVAYAGLTRARRGDVPSWPGLWALLQAARDWLPRRRRPFASAARALLWWEWRCNGWPYPLFVGLMLVLFVPLVPWMEKAERVLVDGGLVPSLPGISPEASVAVKALGNLLLIPIGLSLACGPGGQGGGRRRPFALTPFLATRPVTSTTLVVAKLQVAVLSALAVWVLMVTALAGVVVLAGRWNLLLEVGGSWFGTTTTPQLLAVLAVILAGLAALTWINLISGLALSLTGRRWLILAVGIAVVALGVAAVAFGQWLVAHPEYRAVFRAALPWLLGGVVAVKTLCGGWMLWALRRRGLVTGRSLALLSGLWLLAAGCLLGWYFWMVPSELVPVLYLALGVVLVLPLNRLAAAPLALEWNRHR
jgi:hypothetical protein